MVGREKGGESVAKVGGKGISQGAVRVGSGRKGKGVGSVAKVGGKGISQGAVRVGSGRKGKGGGSVGSWWKGKKGEEV